EDPRPRMLVERRCKTADEVAAWVKEVAGQYGLDGPSKPSKESMKTRYAETAANAALVLIGVTVALLDRQISAQAKAIEEEGGFTERLYRARRQNRRKGP
ncbi:MAG: four helix bundle suffix domain-containing protein, partial [Verrucomicrobia bacterium]|nr:four helix bundle suffix domain-containing protein [Verrucomicrobiota bacterium]